MKKLFLTIALLSTFLSAAQIDATVTEALVIEPKPIAELDALSNKPAMLVNDGNTLLWWNGTGFVDVLGGGGADNSLSVSNQTLPDAIGRNIVLGENGTLAIRNSSNAIIANFNTFESQIQHIKGVGSTPPIIGAEYGFQVGHLPAADNLPVNNAGSVIFDLEDNEFKINKGSGWSVLGSGGGSGTDNQVLSISGNTVSLENGGSVDLNSHNIDYDNTASGLTATNTQAAIDEVASNGGGSLLTKATTAQALTGVDDVTYMTPEKVREVAKNVLFIGTDAEWFLKSEAERLAHSYFINQNSFVSGGDATRLSNIGKTKHVIKSGAVDLTTEDQVISSGNDDGKRAIVSVDDTGEADVTLPNFTANVDQNHLFSNLSAANTLNVLPGSGVSFRGLGKGSNNAFRLLPNSDLVSDANAVEVADGVFKITGNNLAWFSFFTDFYPSGSPESDGTSEGQDISEWIPEGGAVTISVDNTNVDTGSYSLNLTGANAIRVVRDLSGIFEIGETYRISFRLNQLVADGTRLYFYDENTWNQKSGTPVHFFNTSPGWYDYSYDWTADATGIRVAFYLIGATTQTALIDNITITKL